MPSLAHEGNPKEDEIIIEAGSVLSTAQLDIDFRFFGGAPGVPPLVVSPFHGSSSCTGIFDWPEEREAIPWFYNDAQSGGSLTVWTDQLPYSTTNLIPWLDLTIASRVRCCGCLFKPVFMVDIPTMSFQTDAVYPVHDITFGATFQSVTNTPYAGICCWVEDGSTVEDFTGFVLAANHELGVTKLMRYVHQSLCAEGYVYGIINAVPVAADDLMWMAVYTDPNASSVSDTIWFLRAEIEDKNGVTRGATIDIQVHDSLMDVQYTQIGRGQVFTEGANIKPVTYYVYYNADGTPVYSTQQTALIGGVMQTPSEVQPGHRHNRANIGFVSLGANPVVQQNQNQLFVGGEMNFGASTFFFGAKSVTDSYSFGTGTLS